MALHEEVKRERDREAAERAHRASSADMNIALTAETWKPDPLYILAASLGHPLHPAWSADVVEGLRRLIKQTTDRATIDIPAGTILHELLGVDDPCRGHMKVLKVRYELIPAHSVDWRKTASRAETRRSVASDGSLSERLKIGTPTHPPLVKIKFGRWGHPLGGRRGRGSFDVTEALQGMLDKTDAAFLEIPHTEDLYAVFDDPAKGMPKDLVVEYELMGVGDNVSVDEMNDFVMHPLAAKLTPRLAPMLIIRSAKFGLDEEGAAARRKALRKQLYDISVIANRKKQRLYCDPAQLETLALEPQLHQEMRALDPETCEYGCIDVTYQLQRLVDVVVDERADDFEGGDGKRLVILEGSDLRALLKLDSCGLAQGEGEEPNGIDIGIAEAVVGENKGSGVFESQTTQEASLPRLPLSPDGRRDPDEENPWSTCLYKQLIVTWTITGHDSERKTSSEEVTESGGERNFIRYHSGNSVMMCIDAWEEEVVEKKGLDEESMSDSEGEEGTCRKKTAAARYLKTSRLMESLQLEATTVFPVMKIEHARYGHHTDPRKQVDVRSNMEDVVETQGRNQFVVDKSMNLQQLFRVNPLRGYRKLLSVGYVARGLMGTLRVPVDVQTGRLLADLFIGFPPAPPPPPIELESERLAREMREFEEQVEKAKAARSRELRRKHRLRQQGKGGAPRARRTDGGLLGRRVVITEMTGEHEYLNGLKGIAVSCNVGRGTPLCRYSVKIDSADTLPKTAAKGALVERPLPSSKPIQILALKLVDNDEPDDELPEEEKEARAARLEKEEMRRRRKERKQKERNNAKIIRMVRGVRGLAQDA
jgi:hypothetical protein